MPNITITSVTSPVYGQPYTATCVAKFVTSLPMDIIHIVWRNDLGINLAEDSNRTNVSRIEEIDDSTYARNVTVSPITIEDAGTYICEALVTGDFLTSHSASELIDVVVFGKVLY